MSALGWSLPAGCNRTPYDEPDPPCGLCGLDAATDCQCPECTVCEGVGDPRCWDLHPEGVPPEKPVNQAELAASCARLDARMVDAGLIKRAESE